MEWVILWQVSSHNLFDVWIIYTVLQSDIELSIKISPN